jgi:hypothetical protein
VNCAGGSDSCTLSHLLRPAGLRIHAPVASISDRMEGAFLKAYASGILFARPDRPRRTHALSFCYVAAFFRLFRFLAVACRTTVFLQAPGPPLSQFTPLDYPQTRLWSTGYHGHQLKQVFVRITEINGHGRHPGEHHRFIRWYSVEIERSHSGLTEAR